LQIFENNKSIIFQLNITQENPKGAKWEDAAPMKESRVYHHCSRIKRSHDSNEYDVIVVGRTLDYIHSVEIYDTTNKKWRFGPKVPGRVRFLDAIHSLQSQISFFL
jgi:hypothetical protein